MFPLLTHIVGLNIFIYTSRSSCRKKEIKMEQAKSADGYLPKCRSNHLPTIRFFVAELCCHPVANNAITTTTTTSTQTKVSF